MLYITYKGSKKLVIEEDRGVGFYLEVYEDDKCISDYLQDTLEIAMEQAEELFGVPNSSWNKVKTTSS